MFKYLFFSILLLILINVYSQDVQVPDGNFETWNTTIFFEDPISWVTSNENYNYTYAASVFKTTDSYHGSYAIKVQTVAVNTDTIIGLAQSGKKDANGIDILGIPCSVKPTALHCFVKYDCAAFDDASIFVNFKKNGNYFSYNTFYFKGTQNTYKEFTLSLEPLTDTPDTVVIGISSSQVSKKKKVESLNSGNWLEVDYMNFVGANLTIPNYDFEQWNSTESIDPSGWSTLNEQFVIQDSLPYATKTKIVHSGVGALKIQAKEILINGNFQFVSCITTGSFNSDIFSSYGTPDIKGGFPINSIPDTLRFWYKYDNSANTNDSALIILDIKNTDSLRRFIIKLPPVDTFAYITMALPTNIHFVPDSANIILSSVNYLVPSNLGYENILFMDDISFHYGVPYYQLNGNVNYVNSVKTPLSNNVKVFLKNSQQIILDSALTDNLGNYIFYRVHNSTYSLVTKTTKKARATTVVDALTVNRAFVNLVKITDSMKKKAADVNNDTRVNPLDALMILKRFVGLVKKFNVTDWLFETPSVTINNANATVNFRGICAGDVSGLYKPPAN